MKSLLKARLILICGHFGTGKTNIAVNLAECAVKEKGSCVIVDLDIVNPYFRTADNAAMLRAMGVETLIPEFANTNVDIPSLPPALTTIFERKETTVVDVGGDADGAAVLGGFTDEFKACGYAMYYVYNARRPENITPETALASLQSIENASHLSFTGIINNTNLGVETTADIVREGIADAKKFAALASLPLLITTAFKPCFPDVTVIDDVTKKYF